VNKTTYISLAIVLLLTSLASACSKRSADSSKTIIADLRTENARISDQLSSVNSILVELQESEGMLVSQQVIVEPAVFKTGGDTLRHVKDKKVLRCGGNADLPGFGYLDPDSSEFVGFDIDICRAIGAAVLGPEGAIHVEIIPLTSKLRFAALQAGEIDVLTRNTTWTMSRDSELRGDYAGVTFYDGQGVLVRDDNTIKKLSDLKGRSICVQSGSTSESNVIEFFDDLGLKVEIRSFDDRVAALQQYAEGTCDAYTGDKSSLVAQRILLEESDAHTILIDEISREPLGPVIRHDDDAWKDIVTWTIQCLINGEALNVSHKNVEDMLSSEDLRIKRLLGVDAELGAKLGLSNDYCYQVIKQVGNYKDIYNRHLGPATEFNLARGLNALYTDGGILYPLPFK